MRRFKNDSPSLTAYAVDASIYRMTPQAVVLVESEEDIERSSDLPVTRFPVDPARRRHEPHRFGHRLRHYPRCVPDEPHPGGEREERWARVQPGIVLAELNRQLADDLLFGPDPSSGDMCKLGGMVANNSSGPHTLRYGSVKDNVRALRICLPSGAWLSAARWGPGPDVGPDSRAHPALKPILDMGQQQRDLIESKRPTVSKNSCGYNVFGLADGLNLGIFDLPKLFVGSEGTLG